MKRTLITGNTFPVKEELKALGARWDGGAKGWLVPDENLPKARILIANAPKAGKIGRPGFHRNRISDRAPGGRECPSCGARDCPRAWDRRDLCQED